MEKTVTSQPAKGKARRFYRFTPGAAQASPFGNAKSHTNTVTPRLTKLKSKGEILIACATRTLTGRRTLQALVGFMSEKLKSKNAQIIKLQENNASMRNDLMRNDSDSVRKERKLAGCYRNLLHQDIVEKNVEIKKLASHCDDLSKELKKRFEETAQRDKEIKELHSLCDDLNKKLKVREDGIRALSEDVEQVDEDLDEHEDTIIELQGHYEDAMQQTIEERMINDENLANLQYYNPDEDDSEGEREGYTDGLPDGYGYDDEERFQQGWESPPDVYEDGMGYPDTFTKQVEVSWR